jgi:predicted RNA methylase
MDEFFRANLLSWDDRAELHSTGVSSDYPIAKVIAGGSCLHELETQEIGDIRGKDIVHLQCHIGLDTLSLKHLGARSATGLDFSPKAIEAARRFAADAGTEARFVEAPVYDAVEALGATYDMVFVSWGAII